MIAHIITEHSIFLHGCKKNDDRTFFNGEIVLIKTDTVPITNLIGKRIDLNDIFTGYMSVYDSLMLFVSNKFGDKRLYVYNLNTNNLDSKLISIGQGPTDFLHFRHLEQYIVQNSAVKLWGLDNFTGKIFLLNITQSIKNQKDIIDSLFFFNWKDKYLSPIGYIFLCNNNSLLIRSPLEMNNEDNYIPYDYHLFHTNGEKILSYNIYGKPIINTSKMKPSPHLYYDSQDKLKPDNTRLAMGMSMLAQVNILELETGIIKGYRLENTPDFTYLTKSPDNFKFFYRQTCVDDEYIFVLYLNVLLNYGMNSPYLANELHVFDWDGKFIHKIMLDNDTSEIAFDPVKKQLFCEDSKDELFCYDLSFLY